MAGAERAQTCGSLCSNLGKTNIATTFRVFNRGHDQVPKKSTHSSSLVGFTQGIHRDVNICQYTLGLDDACTQCGAITGHFLQGWTPSFQLGADHQCIYGCRAKRVFHKTSHYPSSLTFKEYLLLGEKPLGVAISDGPDSRPMLRELPPHTKSIGNIS